MHRSKIIRCGINLSIKQTMLVKIINRVIHIENMHDQVHWKEGSVRFQLNPVSPQLRCMHNYNKNGYMKDVQELYRQV